MKCIIIASEKNKAPHYFFRRNDDIMRHFIFFGRNNEAPHFFLKKMMPSIFYCANNISRIIEVTSPSASLFLWMRSNASLFLQKNDVPHYFFRKKSAFFFKKNNEALCFFTAWIKLARLLWQQAQVPPYFFNKKRKRLIISSEKNEVPLYFFRKNAIMRCFIFSEEIMRCLIFSLQK